MSDTFTVYGYDEFGYFNDETIEVPINGAYPGPPARWTDVPLPTIPAGMYAVFDHVQWTITAQPRPEPPQEPAPVEPAPVTQPGEAPAVI